MRAIRVTQFGGPEVLTLQDIEVPKPDQQQVLVKVCAAGVNFIDVYQRTGRYPLSLPYTIGMEASGVVEACGSQVRSSEFKPGDRVAFANVQGAYAEYLLVPWERLVKVPDLVNDDAAAAAMLQGMTAHYLSETTYPIQRRDTVLIHAGAGGVGLILTQMAKRRGAKVITTVSTEEKAELSRGAGADEVILYTQADFAAEVKRLTQGAGVHAVYDSVGKTTFDQSLNCLRPLGSMVLYGGASGPVAPFDPMVLSAKGSLFLTRPTLLHYTADRTTLLKRASDVLKWIGEGWLKMRVEHTYPLEKAAQAHRDLESRATTGKLLLKP